MYAFEPRLPIDHVLAAVRMIRSGEVVVSDLLKLIGASTGEIGALLATGPIFSLHDPEMTVEEAIEKLESFEFSVASADPNFDPTPWIPIILFIIEWIMKRRQG